MVNGFEYGMPIYSLIGILPVMLLTSGFEEVGWRMVLQPELEKRFNFNIATLMTSVIWWIWHLPLFLITGALSSNMNYFMFGTMCIVLSYEMAIVRKISKSIIPCVLIHGLVNGLSAIIVFNMSWKSCIISIITIFIISQISIYYIKKCNKKESK